MMGRLGLIAGSGVLPLEFIKSAKEKDEKVIVFALEDMASPELEKEADRIFWVNFGQYKKFVFLLLKERIRRLAFVGKVQKNLIYEKEQHDSETKTALENLLDKKDTSIFNEITKRLRMVGIEVEDPSRYLAHLLPERGRLGREKPDHHLEADISFGFDIAKRIAGMDIGQTVIVKGGSVVAVEAMEGTDETISRAKKIAGEGCVMIKVSRPNQDMRWDVPTVGPDTIEKLAENGFSALAIEGGKMFFIEQEKALEMADKADIVVEVI